MEIYQIVSDSTLPRGHIILKLKAMIKNEESSNNYNVLIMNKPFCLDFNFALSSTIFSFVFDDRDLISNPYSNYIINENKQS